MEDKKINNFLVKARQKYGNKFDYISFGSIKHKCGSRVGIVTGYCKIHNKKFTQIRSNHLKNYGCPMCGKEVSVSKKFLTKEELITKIENLLPNKIDFTKVNYINTVTPINVRCICHNNWYYTTPAALLKGFTGCKYCKTIARRDNNLRDTDFFIKKSRIIHGDKYDYSKSIYVANDKPITIICPEHGEFKQRAGNHHTGSGCPLCAKLISISKRSKDITHFLKRAKKAHGEKYDYSEVEYINNNKPVTIICPTHGAFKQPPYSHYRRVGCPVCSESKGENKIRIFLQNNNIDFIREYRIQTYKYRYDFYIPNINTLIEYDGQLHYKTVNHYGGIETLLKIIEADKIKSELAKNNGFNLIRISYTMYNKLEEYLIKLFSNKFKYRYSNGVFYKNFIDLCKMEKLPFNTKPPDVIKYLLKNQLNSSLIQ